MNPQLFLDCDGVLADFDAGATDILGMSTAAFEERHGRREFWRRIARAREFYARLPLMSDARTLFDAVEHLDPIILTGLPLGNWAAPQKVRWAEEHFPGTHIITCMARDKYRHMKGPMCSSTTVPIIATNGKRRAGSSCTTRERGRASPSSPKSILP